MEIVQFILYIIGGLLIINGILDIITLWLAIKMIKREKVTHFNIKSHRNKLFLGFILLMVAYWLPIIITQLI